MFRNKGLGHKWLEKKSISLGEKEHFSWKKKRVSLVEKNVWITERFFDNHYKAPIQQFTSLAILSLKIRCP